MFDIYRGQRLYDDELPLNKNTPNLGLHRPIDDPAPYIVVVQGPSKVGKSLLIRSIAETFHPFATRTTNRTIVNLPPFTNASGKHIQLQFVECPDDINCMIDAAKYADVAILMVDASYGFEMETFEFRNLLQVHGFPKVIGVLTHLDKVDQQEILKVKQRLNDHFCTEICGAEVFSLSGLVNGLYNSDIYRLSEMLSNSEFLPSSWRSEHPYMLVDRLERVTRYDYEHGQFNTNLILYGYLRGGDINEGAKVHIAGAGDFSLAGISRGCERSGDFVYSAEQSHFLKLTYLKLDVHDVPSEIVDNLDDNFCLGHPILVGGIIQKEENSGFMLVKLRRHSWHMNLLMSGVPINVSAGWRRYQTNVIYAIENENGQHQLLTKTPEHKDCLALIWGPLASPKTTIVAVLNKFYCFKNKVAFRIMAKGAVLGFKHDTQILLEVGRIGTIYPSGKFARIVFKPNLQIDRFIGAIQTTSGIRGEIGQAAGEGFFECTFEDNIPSGDTILFPVLATLVLPSVFQQLNLLVKTLERDINPSSIDAAAGAARIATFATAAVHASIAASLSVSSLASEDKLAVSYEKVAPRWQMLDLRRGVAIHEGKCGYVSFPNSLEIFYSSVEPERCVARGKAIVNKKRECYVAREVPRVVKDIRSLLADMPSFMKRKRCVAQEISGEVKKKHSLDRSEEHISGEVKEKHSLVRSEEGGEEDDEVVQFFKERFIGAELARYKL